MTQEATETKDEPGGIHVQQKPDTNGFKSEESKQSVLADLAKERDERQKLQRQVEEMGKTTITRDQLAALLGTDAAQDVKPEDIVAELKQRVERVEKDNQVLTVANTYKITDEGDLALIAAQPTPDAMSKLAARLKPADGDQKPGTPKPDRSLGRGTGQEKGGTSSVASARDDYLARRNPKK